MGSNRQDLNQTVRLFFHMLEQTFVWCISGNCQINRTRIIRETAYRSETKSVWESWHRTGSYWSGFFLLRINEGNLKMDETNLCNVMGDQILAQVVANCRIISQVCCYAIKIMQKSAEICSFRAKKAKFSNGHFSCKNRSKLKINGGNDLRKTRAFRWCTYLVTLMSASNEVPRGLKR